MGDVRTREQRLRRCLWWIRGGLYICPIAAVIMLASLTFEEFTGPGRLMMAVAFAFGLGACIAGRRAVAIAREADGKTDIID